MRYRVISTFYDRRSDRYVEPGSKCPELDPETAARLGRAGCIVEDDTRPPAGSGDAAPAGAAADAEQPAAAGAAARRRGRAARRTSASE